MRKKSVHALRDLGKQDRRHYLDTWSYNRPSKVRADTPCETSNFPLACDGHFRGNPLTHGYDLILKKMQEFSVSRLVLISTASVSTPEDKASLVRVALVGVIKLIAYKAWTGKLILIILPQ